MEFFSEVYSPGLDVAHLKRLLTINSLVKLCDAISTVNPKTENEGDIYCIWGAFHVRREEIRDGVRFSLSDCPHALAWTVTYDGTGGNVVIHCTIDKKETDPDFAESIDEFVAAWANGIAAALDQAGEAPGQAGCRPGLTPTGRP